MEALETILLEEVQKIWDAIEKVSKLTIYLCLINVII